VKGVHPNEGAKEATLLERHYFTTIAFARWHHTNNSLCYDQCIYMAVNKMSNFIDFKHLQTVLLSVAYARIKTFSSIVGGYYDDKIINVMPPKFLPHIRPLITKKTLFCSYWFV